MLVLPVGTGTLLEHMQVRLAAMSPHPPVVAATFGFEESYREAVRAAATWGDTIIDLKNLREWLHACDASDWLMFVDPRCYPVEPLEPKTLFRHSLADPRWARHLVALDLNSAGTRERVDFDLQGRVRRIRRHYDVVTWPFTAGVACSVLPAACLMVAEDVPFSSLAELRQALASRGVPNRDLPLTGQVLDLNLEDHLLNLSERLVLQAVAGDGAGVASRGLLLTGAGHRIHPSARIVGPVVVHTDAAVGADAKIVGPSVVGPRARIGPSAVVAQSLLAADAIVPSGWVVRHRVLVKGLLPALPSAVGGRSNPLYRDPTCGPVGPPMERSRGPSGRSVYRWVRPVTEAILALVGLLVLSPFLLAVAVAIKLNSLGPVLYGHRREGKHGKPFLCWKFRTMCEDAEVRQQELGVLNQVDGPQFKITADPRLTRLGRWLRSWNIDELPQLINVLMAEMSFVGPRPSPFRENQYCVPWREGRLSVRPGITGLWQVCRHDRESGDFHQWIQYDLLYVRHRSFIVDLKIVLATMLVILRLRGHVPLEWIIGARQLQADA